MSEIKRFDDIGVDYYTEYLTKNGIKVESNPLLSSKKINNNIVGVNINEMPVILDNSINLEESKHE